LRAGVTVQFIKGRGQIMNKSLEYHVPAVYDGGGKKRSVLLQTQVPETSAFPQGRNWKIKGRGSKKAGRERKGKESSLPGGGAYEVVHGLGERFVNMLAETGSKSAGVNPLR